MSRKKVEPEEQYARFIEAAKKAGADGESSAADALMGRLAKTKPAPKTKRRPPSGERRSD
ncbi:hypothetical protein [Methylobacterium sp. J-030]|uniref:hypothetical protein n=1 Tax=Methylobacterium sp. J-030 TaxID=2836627 RepID=UPI00391DD259